MTFSSAVIPLTRLNCWKMKPNVLRRTSVRNRSGRLVMSRPESTIRPDVGRAMHPMMPRRVVLPEPLGPLKTVTFPDCREQLTPSRAMYSLCLPALKTLRMLIISIMSHLGYGLLVAGYVLQFYERATYSF